MFKILLVLAVLFMPALVFADSPPCPDDDTLPDDDAEPTGACCYSANSCAIVGLQWCECQSGVWVGGSSCSPNPCGSQFGACCSGDGGCMDGLDSEHCMEFDGRWAGGGSSCSAKPCDDDASPTDDDSAEKAGGSSRHHKGCAISGGSSDLALFLTMIAIGGLAFALGRRGKKSG